MFISFLFLQGNIYCGNSLNCLDETLPMSTTICCHGEKRKMSNKKRLIQIFGEITSVFPLTGKINKGNVTHLAAVANGPQVAKTDRIASA